MSEETGRGTAEIRRLVDLWRDTCKASDNRRDAVDRLRELPDWNEAYLSIIIDCRFYLDLKR